MEITPADVYVIFENLSLSIAIFFFQVERVAPLPFNLLSGGFFTPACFRIKGCCWLINRFKRS